MKVQWQVTQAKHSQISFQTMCNGIQFMTLNHIDTLPLETECCLMIISTKYAEGETETAGTGSLSTIQGRLCRYRATS